jgi:molecular chaperone GrpE
MHADKEGAPQEQKSSPENHNVQNHNAQGSYKLQLEEEAGGAGHNEASVQLDVFQKAQERIAALEAELAQTKDNALRAMAEADNTRKRALRERDDARKYAASGFSKDLLSVADNFRRALDSVPAELRGTNEQVNNLLTGIEAVEKELLRAFEKEGIAKIEPMDQKFDPNFHEVMFEAPVPGKPSGTIIQVIEPGYILHDRLLRPARVGVVRAEPGSPPESGGHIDTQA